MERQDYAESGHQEVAGEVRAWLARKQVSGRSAAQKLGMTEIYLNRRLRGVVPFNVVDLAALARLLDIPMTAFFDTPEALRMGQGFRTTPSRTPILAAAA
jgi:transcriptional regulator with XRE-family HTH domain